MVTETDLERVTLNEKSDQPVQAQTSKNNASHPPVKQVLTQELQLYYEKITECIKSRQRPLQAMAIESLSADPGIQALMPYFVTFVSDQVYASKTGHHEFKEPSCVYGHDDYGGCLVQEQALVCGSLCTSN